MTFQTNFYIIIAFAIGISVLEACAQNSLKQSKLYQCDKRFYLGVIFYMSVAYGLYKAYQFIGLGQMNLVWSCLSIVMAISAGHLFYNEPFNKYTALSIILAFAAIITAYLSTQYQLNECKKNEETIQALKQTLEKHLTEHHTSTPSQI